MTALFNRIMADDYQYLRCPGSSKAREIPHIQDLPYFKQRYLTNDQRKSHDRITKSYLTP